MALSSSNGEDSYGSDDGNQTKENPIDHETKRNASKKYPVPKNDPYELGIHADAVLFTERYNDYLKTRGFLSSLSSSTIASIKGSKNPYIRGLDMSSEGKNELAKWIEELLDSAAEFNVSSVGWTAGHMNNLQKLHNRPLFSRFRGTEWPEWRSTPAQESILELLYKCGLRSPTMQQIQQITKLLIEYGKVDDMDVYNWFQTESKWRGVEDLNATERWEETSTNLMSTSTEGSKYDNTGKLLQTNFEKQTQEVSSVRENVEVWAKNDYHDLNRLEESDPPHTSLPTVSPSTSFTQGQGSRLQAPDKTKISDPQQIEEFPTSFRVNKRGKGKRASVEEKSGRRKAIQKFPASPRTVSEGDKSLDVSVEEKSSIGKVVSMSSEMSGPVGQEQGGSHNSRYDSTGKLLPINYEKQREQIPTVEENIDVRANIIFLDRDYLEEPDPHVPSQQETSLPFASSTQREESRHQGQNNTEADLKKRKWFKPFSWWQKK